MQTETAGPEKCSLPDSAVPLVVDLDGTLILSDLLDESFLSTLKEKPGAALGALGCLLRKDKAGLKRRLAEAGTLDATLVPLRAGLVDFLREEKAKGRTLVLATASDELLVRPLAASLGLKEGASGRNWFIWDSLVVHVLGVSSAWLSGLVLAALLWTGERTAPRLAGLFAIGLLLAPSGLQLVPATLLLCGLAVLFRPREDVPRAVALVAGLLGGGLLLRLVLDKVLDLPRIYTADKSLVLVAGAALVLLAAMRRTVIQAPLRSPLLFGLAALAVVPSALQVAAKFPLYYSWMAFLPLLTGVVSTLDSGLVPGASRAAALALLVVAGTVGLPLRLAAVASAWTARDPGRLTRDLEQRLTPDDIVVTDFKGYYVVKARALFSLPYLGILTPAEKASITALVLRPEALEAVLRAVGGTWLPAGPEMPAGSVSPEPALFRLARELRDENYPLRFYRRGP